MGQGQATGSKLAAECRGESTSRARGGCIVHSVGARAVLGHGGTAACTCVAPRPRLGAVRAAVAMRRRLGQRQERACGFTFSWTALSVQTGGWRMEHRAADWNLSRATGEAAAHRKAACRSAA